MSEQQFRALLENKRPRRARGLDEPSRAAELAGHFGGRRSRPPLANVVARAARRLRQRKAADQAWPRLARPLWMPHTRVAGIEDCPGGGYVVVLAADSATIHYELRRHKAELERELVRVLPGARGVQFILSGAPAD